MRPINDLYMECYLIIIHNWCNLILNNSIWSGGLVTISHTLHVIASIAISTNMLPLTKMFQLLKICSFTSHKNGTKGNVWWLIGTKNPLSEQIMFIDMFTVIFKSTLLNYSIFYILPVTWTRTKHRLWIYLVVSLLLLQRINTWFI